MGQGGIGRIDGSGERWYVRADVCGVCGVRELGVENRKPPLHLQPPRALKMHPFSASWSLGTLLSDAPAALRGLAFCSEQRSSSVAPTEGAAKITPVQKLVTEFVSKRRSSDLRGVAHAHWYEYEFTMYGAFQDLLPRQAHCR
jgi:hypothetical protein